MQVDTDSRSIPMPVAMASCGRFFVAELAAVSSRDFEPLGAWLWLAPTTATVGRMSVTFRSCLAIPPVILINSVARAFALRWPSVCSTVMLALIASPRPSSGRFFPPRFTYRMEQGCE